MAKWAKNIRAVPSRPNKTITGLLILLHGNTLRICLITDYWQGERMQSGRPLMKTIVSNSNGISLSETVKIRRPALNSPRNISPCEQRMIPLTFNVCTSCNVCSTCLTRLLWIKNRPTELMPTRLPSTQWKKTRLDPQDSNFIFPLELD